MKDKHRVEGNNMNTKQKSIRALALAALFIIPLLPLQKALALPVDLGAAGPGNWAVLEIGNGNVSGAAAPPNGFIHGNVGVAGSGHITTSAGNFPIVGAVYLSSLATADAATAANATGGIVQNAASQALLSQARSDAIAASAAAAGLSTSGGGFTGSINFNDGAVHVLSAGVYNLADLILQGGTQLSLLNNGSYVFNISGHLTLNGSQILTQLGLSAAEVLFNVTGTTGVTFSGGLNQGTELDGIILAPNASVSLTPGIVVGEIIAGGNINIASGGRVQGQVPDTGSTLALLSIGLAFLAGAKRKFRS
jgi:choice-of-anchor A domain-containing protein